MIALARFASGLLLLSLPAVALLSGCTGGAMVGPKDPKDKGQVLVNETRAAGI